MLYAGLSPPLSARLSRPPRAAVPHKIALTPTINNSPFTIHNSPLIIGNTAWFNCELPMGSWQWLIVNFNFFRKHQDHISQNFDPDSQLFLRNSSEFKRFDRPAK